MRQYSPLDGREIVVRKAAPLSIRPLPEDARFSLRLDPAHAGEARAILGLDLPDRIGGVATAGGTTAVRLGPDEWHLIAAEAEAPAIEAGFADLYARQIHSLVDISHRETAIAVEGPDAVLVLRSAVAFDVSAMPVGTGRRTVFDRAQVILLREAEDRFRIEVWRSFSEHVWGLLDAAAHEIALDI